jgi:hypothetical protein
MFVLDAARSAFAAGLCLLPTRDDGSKAPDVSSWTAFQTTRPTVEQMHAFDFSHRTGLGLIAGPVSGWRECWDFDCPDRYQAFVDAAGACGLGDVVRRIRTGYEDETAGGGRRWIVAYPPDVVWRDCTLARRPGRDGEPKIKTLIELPTFAIVAPSNGGTHPSGNPYVRLSGDFDTIASYTREEREALMDLARSFDQMPRREATSRPSRPSKSPTSDRPGDDYNRRMTWPQILEPTGWIHAFDRGDTSYWRRPGKDHGVSASTNFGGSDLLYPFTSSTEFEPDQSYTKFGAYAVLEHDGDFGKAALALAKEGCGQQDGPPVRAPVVPATPCKLADTLAVFRRWLGNEYDLGALHAVLATAAAERLPGDPLWLLVVSGPGNAKTETVQSLAGGGALVTSTITSEGALLSGSAKRERTKDATGGLLRRIGERGLLVIKDVTSILAMNRDTRASLLAAFRELHDGRWERNVGTDGGRSLSWTGHLVIVGAVTTAWDKAHDVIASMGDRFVIVRMDSTTGRMQAGRRACRNTGEETRMRAELAAAVGGVLASVDATAAITLTEEEQERLLEAADVVTQARTGVEYDYRGDVIDAHAPEMPTRFAKQLTQMVRGAVAIGVDRAAAVRLALRCARDSMPPLRLAILDDIAAHPGAQTRDVRRRLEKPRTTVDRQLQSLHMLGVLKCDEEEGTYDGKPAIRWRYRLAARIDPHVLDPDSVPEKCPEIPPHTGTGSEEESQRQSVSMPTDISGENAPAWVTEPGKPDFSDPIGAHDEANSD